MLAEMRKYRVGLVLAHQHMSHSMRAVREVGFGRVRL